MFALSSPCAFQGVRYSVFWWVAQKAIHLRWDLYFAGSEKSDGFDRPNDEVLMQRISADDEAAFRELFDRWKRPLISFFYRSINDYGLAEDLTLDVARKVYSARKRYVPSARFSTWIFQIAHNRLRDEFRKRSRRPQLVSNSADWEYPSQTEPDPRRLMDQEEWLGRNLDTLSENARTVLLLNYQQGFEPMEIADILKISANHARVLLHQARQHMRNRWRVDNAE